MIGPWRDRLRAWVGGHDDPAVPPAESPSADALAPIGLGAGTDQLLRLFEKSDFGLLICSQDGTVRLCSVVAAHLLGAEPRDVAGRRVTEWLAPMDSDADASPAQAFGSGQWETSARRRDGSVFPVELTVSQTRLDDAAALIVILRDITDRKVTQERLSFLANYDSLTGLPNRVLFRDRLARAMARARRTQSRMALMFLDLDQFKVINDSLGHEVGDQLLRHVAETIKNALREVDSVARGGQEGGITVSRLGGDEFTVIAENLAGAEDAAGIARRVLDALEQPWRLMGSDLYVSASIGITMYPDDDTDLDGLIRHTDMAMYRSKEMGRATYCFYSAEMSAAVAARLSMESSLRRALELQQFVLHFQPKAELATGRITGVEALLRWHCPGRGMVPPSKFIEVLEQSALILPVGAWVVRSACAELAAWDQAGLPPMRMAVNLSARQFRQPYLAQFIIDTLRETGIAPERLDLELTERILMEDHVASGHALATLKSLGVRVAMDDFGTGHSSLSYLKRFDIDTLKIDRSFVSELPHDAEDRAIATAIVAMGHSLNMKIVAEGVETDAQAQFLESLGCDEIQGYLLSRPLSSEQFLVWFERREQERLPLRHARAFSDSGPLTLISLGEFDLSD